MNPLHLISPEMTKMWTEVSFSSRLPERRSSTAAQACACTKEASMGEAWQEEEKGEVEGEEEGQHHRVGNNTSIWNQDHSWRPDFHLETRQAVK